MQNFDHNISFWEKRQFFLRKLSKIPENCDHNIDPWMRFIQFLSNFGQKLLEQTFIHICGQWYVWPIKSLFAESIGDLLQNQ
jgi:hypothetical protein